MHRPRRRMGTSRLRRLPSNREGAVMTQHDLDVLDRPFSHERRVSLRKIAITDLIVLGFLLFVLPNTLMLIGG